jgi:3-methyladenine DNA glycosylase AlkC
MPEPLKETLFSPSIIAEMVEMVSRAYPDFDREQFYQRAFDASWPGLELKERIRHLTYVFKDLLPAGYRQAVAILRQAASFYTTGSFSSVVFGDFVEVYGLDDWETSLPALGHFTCLCSAEFAVRPFLLKDLDKMMLQMNAWARSDNLHQRRLASEGCRPRLPWGMAVPVLKINPAPILPILEQLKNDPEEYVRRSLANNLNDISKDHPELVVGLLNDWKSLSLPHFEQIANRALRTLVKRGHPGALNLLGFSHGGAFELQNLRVEPPAIPLGGEITFSFSLISNAEEEQNLVIDYIIHHQRANGARTPKVFKLTQKTLPPGESLSFSKSHSFRQITTRRYYPGLQAIEIQVNGISMGQTEFWLGES